MLLDTEKSPCVRAKVPYRVPLSLKYFGHFFPPSWFPLDLSPDRSVGVENNSMSVAVPEISNLSSSKQPCFFRTFLDPHTEVSFQVFALEQFHLLSQLVLNYY